MGGLQMRALRPFRAISTAVSSRSATAALHTFDPSAIRNEFPAFAAFPDAVFCDGAGGSQIHNSVIEASAQQMIRGSANVGGYYPPPRGFWRWSRPDGQLLLICS